MAFFILSRFESLVLGQSIHFNAISTSTIKTYTRTIFHQKKECIKLKVFLFFLYESVSFYIFAADTYSAKEKTTEFEPFVSLNLISYEKNIAYPPFVLHWTSSQRTVRIRKGT